MKKRILALFTYKGGSSKTWAVINLAAAIREISPSAAIRLVDITPGHALRDIAEDVGLPGVEYVEASISGLGHALTGAFDYALIDCPPEMPADATKVLFAAANLIVVPCRCVVGAVNEAKDAVAEATRAGVEARCFLTEFAPGQNYAMKIRANLRESLGSQMCATVIPMYHAFREAEFQSKTIFQHAPDSAAAKAFLRLTRELDSWD